MKRKIKISFEKFLLPVTTPPVSLAIPIGFFETVTLATTAPFPTSSVTVTASVSSSFTVTPPSATFSANDNGTVTFQILAKALVQGNVAATVTFTATSNDPTYAGVVASYSVTSYRTSLYLVFFFLLSSSVSFGSSCSCSFVLVLLFLFLFLFLLFFVHYSLFFFSFTSPLSLLPSCFLSLIPHS